MLRLLLYAHSRICCFWENFLFRLFSCAFWWPSVVSFCCHLAVSVGLSPTEALTFARYKLNIDFVDTRRSVCLPFPIAPSWFPRFPQFRGTSVVWTLWAMCLVPSGGHHLHKNCKNVCCPARKDTKSHANKKLVAILGSFHFSALKCWQKNWLFEFIEREYILNMYYYSFIIGIRKIYKMDEKVFKSGRVFFFHYKI